jgi:hypothetical protein
LLLLMQCRQPAAWRARGGTAATAKAAWPSTRPARGMFSVLVARVVLRRPVDLLYLPGCCPPAGLHCCVQQQYLCSLDAFRRVAKFLVMHDGCTVYTGGALPGAGC